LLLLFFFGGGGLVCRQSTRGCTHFPNSLLCFAYRVCSILWPAHFQPTDVYFPWAIPCLDPGHAHGRSYEHVQGAACRACAEGGCIEGSMEPDPLYGCKIGSQRPFVHAKWDEPDPFHIRDTGSRVGVLDLVSCMAQRQGLDIVCSFSCEAGRATRLCFNARGMKTDLSGLDAGPGKTSFFIWALKPKACSLSYSACRVGHLVPVQQHS
jgi:hypothetical protein